MVKASDSIFLVPGLGGFGVFGDPEPPSPTRADEGDLSRGARRNRLAYFERAASVLSAHAGIGEHEIYFLEPPPTGSLGARVGYLWSRVVEWALRARDSEAKLHLVGHSTGGLDVRLLLNPEYLYLWPHATRPRHDVWEVVIARIGGVVALSAPMWGSPLVDLIPGSPHAAATLLSLLAIAGERRVLVPGRSILLGTLVEILSRGDVNDRAIGGFLHNMDDAVKAQVGHFLADIATDHRLLEDLRPSKMLELNAKILTGDAKGRVKIACSVAPEPKAIRTLTHGWRAILYAYMHARARCDLGHRPRSFPWVGAGPKHACSPDATDGVVPLSSQTIDGTADAIVFGDHFDVVGHYPKGRAGGVTLLNSGARFTDRSFDALWTRIAQLLG
jgi:hypothetical protein